MIHTIIYYGSYDLNQYMLTPDTSTRVNASGGQSAIKRPSKKVTGIVFGYMEDLQDFYAVRVEIVVLRRPVKLTLDRHTDGKSFGPGASLFGDASARNMLDDIISSNPSQQKDLVGFYSKISS